MTDAAPTIAERLDVITEALDALLERTSAGPAPRWLSIDDAARYAGVSPRSIRGMIASGELAAHRPVRGRIVVDRLALDALIVASAGRELRRGRGIRRRASA